MTYIIIMILQILIGKIKIISNQNLPNVFCCVDYNSQVKFTKTHYATTYTNFDQKFYFSKCNQQQYLLIKIYHFKNIKSQIRKKISELYQIENSILLCQKYIQLNNCKIGQKIDLKMEGKSDLCLYINLQIQLFEKKQKILNIANKYDNFQRTLNNSQEQNLKYVLNQSKIKDQEIKNNILQIYFNQSQLPKYKQSDSQQQKQISNTNHNKNLEFQKFSPKKYKINYDKIQKKNFKGIQLITDADQSQNNQFIITQQPYTINQSQQLSKQNSYLYYNKESDQPSKIKFWIEQIICNFEYIKHKNVQNKLYIEIFDNQTKIYQTKICKNKCNPYEWKQHIPISIQKSIQFKIKYKVFSFQNNSQMNQNSNSDLDKNIVDIGITNLLYFGKTFDNNFELNIIYKGLKIGELKFKIDCNNILDSHLLNNKDEKNEEKKINQQQEKQIDNANMDKITQKQQIYNVDQQKNIKIDQHIQLLIFNTIIFKYADKKSKIYQTYLVIKYNTRIIKTYPICQYQILWTKQILYWAENQKFNDHELIFNLYSKINNQIVIIGENKMHIQQLKRRKKVFSLNLIMYNNKVKIGELIINYQYRRVLKQAYQKQFRTINKKKQIKLQNYYKQKKKQNLRIKNSNSQKFQKMYIRNRNFSCVRSYSIKQNSINKIRKKNYSNQRDYTASKIETYALPSIYHPFKSHQ